MRLKYVNLKEPRELVLISNFFQLLIKESTSKEIFFFCQKKLVYKKMNKKWINVFFSLIKLKTTQIK